MGEPDGGGRAPVDRWRAAHDTLHQDTMALMRIVADKELGAAKLGVLASHADRLTAREEKIRLVEAEREAFRREGAAVMRLIDEVGAAREICLAEYEAGREDAYRRAQEASLLLRPETSGEEKQAVVDRLVAEVGSLKDAFDKKHTTAFLRLRDQVRSWLERYDPSGALREAGRGGRHGA